MQKELIAALISATSLVASPVFAGIDSLPTCPDKVAEQTCPCRPTATTEINSEKVDVKNLPACPDSLEDQQGFGKCRPMATTEIRTELDMKSLPICPDNIEEQEKVGPCRPTPTTEIKTTSGSDLKCGESRSWTSEDGKHGWSEGVSCGVSYSRGKNEPAESGESHAWGTGHGYSHSFGKDESCGCGASETNGESHAWSQGHSETHSEGVSESREAE